MTASVGLGKPASAEQFRLDLGQPPLSFLDRERPERVGTQRARELVDRIEAGAKDMIFLIEPQLSAAHEQLAAGLSSAMTAAARYEAGDGLESQVGRLALPSRLPLRASFGQRPRSRPGVSLAHPGWTFATPAGSPITAPARGVVLHVGFIDGLGGTILIAHDQVHLTLITHLTSIDVTAGEVVSRGDRLGSGGALSAWGTEDTYFEIRVNGIPVDPAPWMANQPPRARSR